MAYRLTVKVEEKQGQDWVEKWVEITECTNVRMGNIINVQNGDNHSRRYEVDVSCEETPG